MGVFLRECELACISIGRNQSRSLLRCLVGVRWHYEGVLDRAMVSTSLSMAQAASNPKKGMEAKKVGFQNVAAHFYDPVAHQWIVVANHERLKAVLSFSSPRHTALILMAHLNLNQFGDNMLTLKYETNVRNPIEKPKMQVFSMYNSSADEALNEKERREHGKIVALPRRLIVCKSKDLVAQATKFASDLARSLEHRLGRGARIRSLELVVLCESVLGGASTTLGGQQDPDQKKVWLHHVSRLSYDKAAARPSGGDGDGCAAASDNGLSEWGGGGSSSAASFAGSKMTTASRALSKTGRACKGDFCYYDPVDPQNDPSFNFDEDDENFDIKAEKEAAILRHRRANGEDELGGSPSGKGALAYADGHGSVQGRAYRESGEGNTQGMHPIAHHIDSVLSRRAGRQGRLDDMQPVPFKTHLKVAMKSVLLARQDMAEVERLEQSLAAGAQDVADVRLADGPTSSAMTTAVGKMAVSREEVARICPPRLMTWWCKEGRTISVRSSDVAAAYHVPLTSSYSIGQAMYKEMQSAHTKILPTFAAKHAPDGSRSPSKARMAGSSSSSSSSSKADLKGLGSHARARALAGVVNPHSGLMDLQAPSNQQPYSIPDKPSYSTDQDLNSLGKLQAYYSEMQVCETCYGVYRELDQRRKARHKSLFQTHREGEKEGEEPSEQTKQKWREIERRIFEQRRLVSRLSVVPAILTETSDGYSGNDLTGMDDASMGYYDDSVSALTYAHSKAGAGGAGRQTGPNGRPLLAKGAPKGALPPLPWNLSDPAQRAAYEKAASATHAQRAILQHQMTNNSRRHPQQQQQQQPAYEADDGSVGGVGVEDQWRQLTESNLRSQNQNARPQKQYPPSRKQVQPVKVDKRGGYTADSLMHPWQRDLRRMKQINTSDVAKEVGATPADVHNYYYESQRLEQEERELLQKRQRESERQVGGEGNAGLLSPKQKAEKKKVAQGARGAVAGAGSTGLRETRSADLLKKYSSVGREEREREKGGAAADEDGSGLARHNSLPTLPKKRAVSGGATRAATFSFAKNDVDDDEEVDADTDIDNQLLSMIMAQTSSTLSDGYWEGAAGSYDGQDQALEALRRRQQQSAGGGSSSSGSNNNPQQSPAKGKKKAKRKGNGNGSKRRVANEEEEAVDSFSSDLAKLQHRSPPKKSSSNFRNSSSSGSSSSGSGGSSYSGQQAGASRAVTVVTRSQELTQTQQLRSGEIYEPIREADREEEEEEEEDDDDDASIGWSPFVLSRA